MSSPALSRVVRRETHSPRTVALVVAAVLVIAIAVYAIVELVLAAAEQPALLIAPADALDGIADLPTAEPLWILPVTGVVLAILGLVFLVLALSPGRLAKHELEWDGTVVVADNGVLAASLAQRISTDAGIPRDDITVGLSHRTADVSVRETSGLPVDEAEVRRIADAELERLRLRPTVRTRVRTVAVRERSFDA